MTTPQTAQPGQQGQQHGQQFKVPHDKIAMRAYEKWVKKGRPLGSNEQDWFEAEAELKSEFSRGTSNPSQTNQRR